MKIEATVLEKTKGPKKIVFKMKRRKGYRRWKGKFHIPSDNFICAEFTRISVFFSCKYVYNVLVEKTGVWLTPLFIFVLCLFYVLFLYAGVQFN